MTRSSKLTKCVFVVVLFLDFVISKRRTTTKEPTSDPDETTTPEVVTEPTTPTPTPTYTSVQRNPNFRWRYGAEHEWPGLLCGPDVGSKQSPINIKTSEVKEDFREEFIKYGPLKFKGYHDVLVTGVNNGRTLQFSTEGEYRMHPTLTGGPLARHYRLEQLHFHWLSEHAVNGQKFPLELHFVHVRSDLDVDQALQEPDGLAILAVFSNVHPELSTAPSAVNYELMQQLGTLLTPGLRSSGVLIDLTQLLSPDRKVYYTYEGSLTTPECNEAVVWIIFKKPIYISEEQYRLFFKAGIHLNNSRSLQRTTSSIKVWGTPNREITTPVIVRFFTDFTNYIRDLFQNITTFFAKGLRDDTL